MAETFLEMAIRHRAVDGMLAKGAFEWNGHSACSVGCFNHELGNDPSDFAGLSQFSGYPEWAHRIQEALFEGLPEPENRDWHVQFAETCGKITDWEAAYHKYMVAILGVALPYDTSGRKVVQCVIDLHRRGSEVTQDEWDEVRDAAAAAARDAGWDAARAAAARDAGWAARAAAWAAWDAAEAAGAAREAAFITMRDAFISLGENQ